MWCLYCSDFCVGLLKGSWLIYCQHFSKDDKMAPQNVLRALSLLCNFTCWKRSTFSILVFLIPFVLPLSPQNSTYNVPWSTPSSSSESHTAFSHSRLNNDSPLSPPPHKRSRSTEPPQYPSSPHTPNHTDHAQPSRESLLSQALESTPHLHNSSNQVSSPLRVLKFVR